MSIIRYDPFRDLRTLQEEVNRLIDRLYQPGSDHTHVNKVLALVVFQEWYELYMS